MPTCDTITNLDDVLIAAIIKTTVFVGEELLKNHAILLPSVHDSFTNYAKELLAATNRKWGGGGNQIGYLKVDP